MTPEELERRRIAKARNKALEHFARLLAGFGPATVASGLSISRSATTKVDFEPTLAVLGILIICASFAPYAFFASED